MPGRYCVAGLATAECRATLYLSKDHLKVAMIWQREQNGMELT